MVNPSVIQYFLAAGPVVKFVMLILFFASFVSWVFIFQRWFFLRWLRKGLNLFENKFWHAENLTDLYKNISAKKYINGLGKIFCAGLREFAHVN